MKESFNPEQANRFIESHYDHRATDIAPLSGGEWSSAYALSLDGKQLVARFGEFGEDYEKDQIMASRSSSDLPIPRVLELGETENRAFAISERAHGIFLDDLDEQGMRSVLPSLLRTLDAIRDIDVSDFEGYGIWTPDGHGPQRTWSEALLRKCHDEPGGRTHGWREALEGSPTGAGQFDAALQTLRELVVDLPSERHIIHNDLLYHNVLVEGDKLSAVIDWGNSKYGDHLYDAAWLLYWWSWYPAWSNIDIRSELQAHWESTGSVPSDLEARLRCYQIHIGLDAQTYNAFTGRWDDLANNAAQTLALTGN